MITVRSAGERGRVDHGWLDARHTFSFASYQDPAHTRFRQLRVLNEDRVAPGQGFPRHGHRDMEILTYVVDGALAHEDSMGHRSTIHGGGFQRITAGRGIEHSEFNASDRDPVHLLQIWIFPEAKGAEPSYEESRGVHRETPDRLVLAASRGGRDGSLAWLQDVDLYAARLTPGAVVTHRFEEGRHGWLQAVSGDMTLNGVDLSAGDGAAITGEPEAAIAASTDAELLLFDLT